MKRGFVLFALLWMNSVAQAEFRQMDLTIYGMD
jgi:hypothetical protein